jgi:8-oxo-dGTP pyrophosphatase MutT (NUDIX family)
MMDLTLLRQKDKFPLYVLEELNRVPVDYRDKHLSIAHSKSTGASHLEAGVVLLLHYQNSGYTFQLIKRSQSVAQAGDISCPGGMLEPRTDAMLSHILFKTEMIRTVDGRSLNDFPGKDKQTASLIRLFLMNALRESWEEIGLDPLNVFFLGALPTYSLTFFSRTIFPLVSLVREPFDYRLSAEVEKVMEIPVDYFFQSSFYAELEIESGSENSDPRYNMKFPCLVVNDEVGHEDILWGATFNIIVNFLQTITGNPVPPSPPSRIVKKMLSPHYASGKR